MSMTLVQEVEMRYYTLGQAAQRLQRNPATLWRWIKDGKITAYRIGREVLIEKTVVEALRK